jgi:hypothetical protein
VSYTSLSQQMMDAALANRCNAAAQKEAWNNPELGASDFGRAVRQQQVSPNSVFMWPLCCATEAAYEYAQNAGNENPGGDPAVITDADILSSVQANWPAEWPPPVTPPPGP